MKSYVYTIWYEHPIVGKLNTLLGLTKEDCLPDQEMGEILLKKRMTKDEWGKLTKHVYKTARECGLKITKITYDGVKEVPNQSANLNLRRKMRK